MKYSIFYWIIGIPQPYESIRRYKSYKSATKQAEKIYSRLEVDRVLVNCGVLRVREY